MMKLPEVKGFIDVSLVDWDGAVSSVIFLPYCNFLCPFCHNSVLVLEPKEMETIHFLEIREYLVKSRNWLDGVTITGGEPTIHRELPVLCRKIKELGLKIKLDTNGTNPRMIQKLLSKKLVDYVAVDVKAPISYKEYSRAAGVDTERLLPKIEKTLDILLRNSTEYELRTTLVPTIHDRNSIRRICERIVGCKKYVLQNFRSGVQTLNPKFRNLEPFSDEDIEEFSKLAENIVHNTLVR